MHPIENIMKNSMEQIKEMVDVNTIIGTPIVLGDENMILPVSKVCLGFFSGGGEYNGNIKSPVRQSGNEACGEGQERFPFAGASAAGMTLCPVAFLSVKDSFVKVLPVQNGSAWDRVIDMIFPLISQLASKTKEPNSQETVEEHYEEHREEHNHKPRYRRVYRRGGRYED